MRYGYDLEKMAKAAAMGMADPTAVVLAGMLKKRGDAEAQKAQVPQQTIAQQVFAPAAAGLGATPQAAAMPPMDAMPPMGAAPPQGEMPMMAEGGMVPPYMSGGGLSDLPVPDGMFDEPSNGGFGDGYAGGGMVAFADAGPVKEKDPRDVNGDGVVDGNDIYVPGAKTPEVDPLFMQGMAFAPQPNLLANLKQNIASSSDLFDELSPYKTKRAKQIEALLEEELSPEAQKSRAKEDMNMALIKAGVAMANTPGSLIQSATAGIGAALPGFEAAAKERRGAKRSIVKELLSEERLSNKEMADRFNTSIDMVLRGVVPLEEAFQDRNFRDRWEKMASDDRRYIQEVAAAAGVESQKISTSGQIRVGGMDLAARRGAFFTSTLDDFKRNAPTDPEYLAAVEKGGFNAGQRYLYNEAAKQTSRVFGGGSTLDFRDMGK